MSKELVTLPTNVFTIQDVILDSPVWKTNALHLQEQIDQFEKWIDGFTRALRSYVESIHKYNIQASVLCKRTFFHGLDGTLIGNVVTKFATTLQSTIAHKTKMVSDLEEILLNPLQNLLKTDLKTYKDTKRQYEKVLDRFETQLSRYYVLNKQKESSSLREDTFQLYEQKKLYTTSSNEYFIKLISFKANLENLLVECFSGALSLFSEELNESNNTFDVIKLDIRGWKQWLEESNVTTEYQLSKIQKYTLQLQNDYLSQIKPSRSLKAYAPSNDQEDDLMLERIQGYLNYKIKPNSNWSRRWFFLENGWLGSCIIKDKSRIQFTDLIQVKDIQFRISNEFDNRRFTMEISHENYTLYLQTETHKELKQWLLALEYNAALTELSSTSQSPKLVLLPKSVLKSNLNSILSMSTFNLLTVSHAETTTASCLITLLLNNINHHNVTTTILTNQPNSWNIPWLTSSINLLSNNNNSTEQPRQAILWPNSNIEVNTLTSYSNRLKSSQVDLRNLFLNVPKDEVVIESFQSSLYRQPSIDDDDDDNGTASYGYTGLSFVTQKHIWFYSCNLMTCVNMMMIPLDKINSIRLENTYHSNGTLLMVETADNTICFGLWLESADIICEKLNYIIENINKKSIQEVYNYIRLITSTNKRKSNITTRLTTSISLHASVTPLTVRAQQIMLNTPVTATIVEQNEEEEDHRPSPAQDALAAVAALDQKHNTKPVSVPVEQDNTNTEWPSDVPLPKEPVACSCSEHLEKIEIDMILPVSAQKLFHMLFKMDEIWNQLNESKKCTKPTFSEWQDNQRIMEYVMPVSNPMVKVKEADVNETQEMMEQKEHVCYVVVVTTRTPTLPYADAFLPTIKYCISFETMNSCRLKCSIGVKWLKSIFVKGMVNRAAMKGMQETISGLVPILEKECRKLSKTTQPQSQQQQQQQEYQQEQKSIIENKSRSSSSSSWLHLFTFILGILCALFTLYQMILQKRYQYILEQHKYITMTWRGVYLKDLDSFKNDTKIYDMFKETRHEITQYKYEWQSKQHRKMAMELSYSRERLGIIRYELLSILRILNRVENELLENEYWNWLNDKQLNCPEQLCKSLENEMNLIN